MAVLSDIERLLFTTAEPAMSDPQIGIVILAAGGSTKLGSPKQLVQFKGRSLIRRSVETALAANTKAVVVVLGSNGTKIGDEINDLSVEIVVVDDWSVGISSSLKLGLTKLGELHPEIDAALIMLCDQPFVTEETIRALINSYRKGNKPIAACEYDGILGVPALFARELFDELMALEGDAGARVVIRKDPNRVATVAAPEAAFDVDTPVDREKLRKIEIDKLNQKKGTANK